MYIHTVEPLVRGHPDEKSTPVERPLFNVNLDKKVLISTPNERPLFWCKKGGLTSGVKLYVP